MNFFIVHFVFAVVLLMNNFVAPAEWRGRPWLRSPDGQRPGWQFGSGGSPCHLDLVSNTLVRPAQLEFLGGLS